MTYLQVMDELAAARISFSVTYSGEEDEYYVVHVEGPIKADQLKVLTELHFNFVSGQFHLMGELT